jgi:transcriptional regulator with PAS, ATPase and Fis domain
LEGQTGTGKELIARAVHKLSSRSENPFIAIDCGAIPQNLMESELFGHVKGAFTGANRDRTGLLVEANKGTLFLDEVNNLTMEMQSKLLRTIQEGEVRPVGGNRNIKIDVRIISASSLSLTKLIEEEKFRRDLYFRLMVYPIYVPPLCERKNDIPILANYFLSKFAKKQKKRIQYFHRDIEDYLKNREYPGNIRELENFVERLVTLASNNLKVLEIKNLPKSFSKEISRSTKDIISPQIRSLSSSLKEYEKNIILQSLEDNDCNQNNVAKSLNVLEQTLRAKMKRLGISRRR